MAKRQNFVVGSTNATTASLTPNELNHAWDEYEILTAQELNGTFNAVSDYSNDSSNEIANAIESLTGAAPTGASQTELAGALQHMRDEIETTSLTFKGYVSSTQPSSGTYTFKTGDIWIQAATMPTSFPVAIAGIWNGTAWESTTSTYTQKDFDFFRNINDNEGYYWFGGQWKVMSTDMDSTYFELNPSGKWTFNSTAKNVSNWSTNMTNCITEIPQHINLELSGNSIVLKAGSVVYVPTGVEDGEKQFTPYHINSDLTASITWGVNGTTYLYYDVLTSTLFVEHPDYNKGSGTTGVTDGTYFYTNTNYIVRMSSGQQTRTLSFPLAKITITSSNTISSIDQIFNGFGYIGSTVFVLPGVKGLVPNGRNEDGSLKTIHYSISQVVIRTEVGTSVYNYEFSINTNGYINYSSKYTLGDDGFLHIPNGNIYFDFTFARYSTDMDGNITSFDTKSVFHAFDYNDISTVLDAIWPVGSTYLGTQATCPLAALIPGSSWGLVSSGYALWTGNGTTGSGTTANANYANAPANTTIAAGAPEISGTFKANAATMYKTTKGHITETTGAFSGTAGTNSNIDGGDGGTDTYGTISFNASSSNSIYGNSTTVQPPAYVVNVWVRVA